jgi:ribose 1,5-bisphosphokinase
MCRWCAVSGAGGSGLPDPSGCFVAVVGPSGSGKDTLINWLRPHLDGVSGFVFVRRAVTRDADADLEDHHSFSHADFAEAESAGRFAVVWEAHGLRYGIPSEALDIVANGGIAIANGSRRALADIARAFGSLLVVRLTVDREVLSRRLQSRGRETAAEIEARLSRAGEDLPVTGRVVTFDNSGPVDIAGTALLDLLREEFALAPVNLPA